MTVPVNPNYSIFMSRWRLLFADILYCSIILLMTMISRSQWPLMIGFFLTFFYLNLTGRFYFAGNLVTAFLIGLIWVSLAKENYHYGENFIEINGFCLYPVFVWATGLFATSILFSHFERGMSDNPLHRLLLFSLVCTFLIIFVEYSAYNIFHFRNQATLKYRPIPVINCIHAPVWMQVAYFLLGPVYGIMVYSVRLISSKFRA